MYPFLTDCKLAVQNLYPGLIWIIWHSTIIVKVHDRCFRQIEKCLSDNKWGSLNLYMFLKNILTVVMKSHYSVVNYCFYTYVQNFIPLQIWWDGERVRGTPVLGMAIKSSLTLGLPTHSTTVSLTSAQCSSQPHKLVGNCSQNRCSLWLFYDHLMLHAYLLVHCNKWGAQYTLLRTLHYAP